MDSSGSGFLPICQVRTESRDDALDQGWGLIVIVTREKMMISRLPTIGSSFLCPEQVHLLGLRIIDNGPRPFNKHTS